ncbi:translation initiation factor IF-2-like [Oenanthe melanoleuca]|uniref:translation initiation factor IF-2-like n=1 Tax=Oenanthe melanoleuca TaxID=2939378 RepID=UPI0024C1B6AD|nr:translation initiation factor IF-2-like [Oenanthe melanoleuca]
MSSGEATRSDNGTQGPPQDRNQSKMDAIEDLRKKLQELEKRNLELASKHNQDMSHYEKDLMKLRLELEKGEALRRVLESEMFFARKDAQVQMYSAEDELWDTKAKLLELQDTFQPPVSPSAFNAPAAPTPTPEGTDIFEVNVVPQADRTPPAPVSPPDDTSQPPVSPPSASAPAAPAPAPEDTSQPPVSPPSASAPAASAPAPEVHQGDPRHRTYALSATDIPSDGTLYITRPEPGTDATIESFQLPFVPQEISTSEGPAPDVHSGQPGHRTYVLSGSDIPSGGTPYRTYTLPGTDTASESIRSYFVPQGFSTSHGPPSDGRWGQPEQRTYIFSGSDISSGRTPYRTYTLPGMDTTSVQPDLQ